MRLTAFLTLYHLYNIKNIDVDYFIDEETETQIKVN